ncbi:Uncharacterised protein [Staphylococcus epidermidis]|uniref:hypothetical protein n=1 Tax=Staphylococcus epidermidis TaxID=1282 RepID=UPI000DF9BBE2|nr:hypothetical protein [Staphylococcus epidermidis]SUM53512.1 Uncharacterised protein [Staphylococcus epidermidis]SUM53527.1 Uncharacterised protein [Staphylococcus epidermidis]
MEMQLTKKEDFLIGMTLYLLNGNDLPPDQKRRRTEDEVREILNDPNSFREIDVIKDELSYFMLGFNDFKWEKG